MSHDRAKAAACGVTSMLHAKMRVCEVWNPLPESEKNRLFAGVVAIAEAWLNSGVHQVAGSATSGLSGGVCSASDDRSQNGALEIMVYLAGENPAFGEAWSVDDSLKATLTNLFSIFLRRANDGHFDSRTEPIAQGSKDLPHAEHDGY